MNYLSAYHSISFSFFLLLFSSTSATLPSYYFHSLLDFFGGEVQVSVADPLNLKPVLEIVVSTTAELHLQTINGLFLETAARYICVLVETNPIPEANLIVGEKLVEKENTVDVCFFFTLCGKLQYY